MEWAQWHLDPRHEQYKRHCNWCQAEQEGVICFRDLIGHNGRCPVEDDGPDLAPENSLVVSIWHHAQRAANQVQAKDKAYIYCRPESVESLLRVNQIEPDRWPTLLRRLALLDDVANDLRPLRAPVKTG